MILTDTYHLKVLRFYFSLHFHTERSFYILQMKKNPEWRMIPKLTFLFDAYNSYEVKSLMWTLVKQWSDKLPCN